MLHGGDGIAYRRTMLLVCWQDFEHTSLHLAFQDVGHADVQKRDLYIEVLVVLLQSDLVLIDDTPTSGCSPTTPYKSRDNVRLSTRYEKTP